MGADTMIQLANEGLSMVLWLSLPMLAVALIVGVLISLIQAMTQVQEMTLTFVPKIIAVFVTIIVAAPWLTEKIVTFTRRLIQSIPGLVG